MEILRVYKNGRIAYYGLKGDSTGFWSQHWEKVDWRAWLESGKNGDLGHFEKPFLKHLPKRGKILEAGCGLGQMVVALKARGYDIEGVEFSEKTVAMVNDYLRNDCSIRVGDVRDLNCPDDYYSAYVSLGVVEHFRDGPQEVLNEARRVVKPGGILILSVPRINPFRKLKATLGIYSDEPTGEFYQYLFEERDVCKFLASASFTLISKYYYGAVKGLRDELPPFKYFHQKEWLSPEVTDRINGNRFLLWLASHMVLFVAQKGRAID